MRKYTKLLVVTVGLAAAGWFAGCNSRVDEEPNVVLEIQQLNIPPITATANGPGGACTFTITQATGTFKNLPKNQFSTTSPFNDIILENMVIAYTWDDGAPQAPVTAGLGGAVPANGTASVNFSVVSNLALANQGILDPPGTGRAGHTANLAMTFFGTTVAGDAVSATWGGALQVNSCTVDLGACCGGINSNGCQDQQSETACVADGGSYMGDNTTCATLPNGCPP